MFYPPAYLEFLRLFNAAKFFKAHEVLENLWRATAGEEKLFYQGLVQAAVALHHAGRKNAAGAEYECARASEKLAQYPAVYLGLDVRGLRDGLERSVREGAPPPALFIK